jgi:uncharacterized protein
MNALITGGSNGIGLELAKQFANNKTDIILVAREQKGLGAAADQLSKRYGVEIKTIAMDLSLHGAAQELYNKVKAMGWQIDYLVNDAGFGDFGPFIATDPKKEESMMMLNMVALTQLCKLFLPDMVARKQGRILNVASSAAFLPGPFFAVYFATKAYVLSFSQAINNELKGTGITVTALCPFATKTNFEKAAHADNSKLFKNNLSSAEDVARYGYRAMMNGKSVAIPGAWNRVSVFFGRFLSRDALTAVSRSMTDSEGPK